MHTQQKTKKRSLHEFKSGVLVFVVTKGVPATENVDDILRILAGVNTHFQQNMTLISETLKEHWKCCICRGRYMEMFLLWILLLLDFTLLSLALLFKHLISSDNSFLVAM